MATVEVIFEAEITRAPISRDQSRVINVSASTSAHPTPAIKTPSPATASADQAPPPAHDTGPNTPTDTPETQKSCSSALLEDNATPQVCQQVEIVTEESSISSSVIENSSTESCLPKIDAVWSISQEHSYEQKVHKRIEYKAFVDEKTVQTEQKQDAFVAKSSTRCEAQHVPLFIHTQTTETLKSHNVHTSQIVKIQNKPSQKFGPPKFFIGESADFSFGNKYLGLHSGGKAQTGGGAASKNFKTLKFLQLPSHCAGHSSLKSCLIDHNLKPLQIQHNLEHKNKALAVLKLEALKYRDADDDADEDDTPRFSFHNRRTPSPAGPFLGAGCSGQFLVKSDDVDDPEEDREEVGVDAVYMDVDDPSTSDGFMDTTQDFKKRGWKEEERAGGGGSHSLSMDHYLPDFTDLPPFPNIMDQPEEGEEQCCEPTHLTPSIQHNVFDYDWPNATTTPSYPFWNPSQTPSPTPLPMDSACLSTPTPIIMVPNMEHPSLLTHTHTAPSFRSSQIPISVDSRTPHGQFSIPPSLAREKTHARQTSRAAEMISTLQTEKATALPKAGGGDCSESSVLPSVPAALEGASTSAAAAATPLITVSEGADGASVTIASIKTESQGSWNGPAHTPEPPPPPSTPTTPSFPLAPPPTPTSTKSQPTGETTDTSSDNNITTTEGATISTALMTAFDLDPHPDLHLHPDPHLHPDHGEDNPVCYPYPDHSYPEPPSTITNFQLRDDPSPGVSKMMNVGCSSSFLSPPPSVERQTSQRSTPCLDNESGYFTMEEHELPSPAMYWPHPTHPPPPNHYQPHYFGFEDTDAGYGKAYPATITSEFGEGGGSYPYTHQDSHYQTLNQTASSSSSGGSKDIIYYPFSDLMQINPSLLGNDQDMSVQYVHPNPPSYHYAPHASDLAGAIPSGFRGRKKGRPKGSGGRRLSGQIQSDQISSSLHRQLQIQGQPPLPKRQYRRRNPDAPRRKSAPKVKAEDLFLEGLDRRGRHNEPLNQRAVDIMYEWYRQHEDNPYPTKEEKEVMAAEGCITTMQVKSWFANKRNRSNNTRPKVQKRAMEEKLMQIYQQLSRSGGDDGNAGIQEGGNSTIIRELSQIINNKLEPTSLHTLPEGGF